MARSATSRGSGWAAMLALTLAAGSVAAQEVPPSEGGEEFTGEEVGVVVSQADGGAEEDAVFDDGTAGGEDMVYLDEPIEGVGTCDGCGFDAIAYGGEVSDGPGETAFRQAVEHDEGDHDDWRFGRSLASSNACLVPELYVAWLCEGYPQP